MKMRLCPSIVVILSLIFGFTTPFVQADSALDFQIAEGKSQVITMEFAIEKVATGDPGVCQTLKTSTRGLLINAKKKGRCNIIVWGTNGATKEFVVTVVSQDILISADELREIFKEIEGVEIKSVGNRILIEGEVFSNKDFDRIQKITAGMPNIVNLIGLSPLMKTIVKQEIDNALEEEGLGDINLKVGKNRFVLTGKVGSEAEALRAVNIARAYSPDIVNAIEIDERTVSEQSQLIELKLNVMEIEKQALKEMNLNWNPGGDLNAAGSYSGSSGNSPSLAGALTGTLSSLLPKMKKLQDQGQGRSLMEQSLITQSGGSADFFAGTEVPIPVAQDGGAISVEYKKIGVTLEFSPVIDAANKVTSPIKIEASSVTGEGAGGAPIISSNRINTLVSVQSGNSIALAGLIGQREKSLISGSAPGGQSSLFQANKGKHNENETREVLIFVTPTILASGSDAVSEIGTKVEDSFKKQELQHLREQLKEK